MNNNDKLDDLDHEYSRSEELFKYDDTFFCNDILSATDDFFWTKKPIGDYQKIDFLMINDSKRIIRNRNQLYVGNLTRWTTDEDISDCIISIGVSDLIDVTFFENYESGQSKGFCIITLQSEHSVKLILNKLPNKKLYGKSPIVTYVTFEAYLFFQTKSNTQPMPSLLINQNIPDISNRVMQESVSENPLLLMQEQSTSILMKDMQLNSSENSYNQGLPRSSDRYLLNRLNLSINAYKQGLHKKFQAMPLSRHDLLSFDVGNHSSNLAYTQDISIQGQQLPKYATSFSNTPSSVTCKHNEMEISPQKFNEIIRRNRIISSSAIARAITNSENGEFSDAMETLITAIKLIKESKIANHESSNIIVRSLQDVLHIIEIKNYNSRKEKSVRKKKLNRQLKQK